MTDVLAGQTALVTGASRGIGRAIAEALAEAGAKVIGTATSAAGAESISGWLGAKSTPGRGAVLDVADASSVEALLAGLDSAGEMPAILVNNAGITRDQLMLRMKRDDWDAVIQTNLTGAFVCVQAVLKPMVKQRAGRIISITSVVGQSGNAGQANYAASKAGLIGFAKALVVEQFGAPAIKNARQALLHGFRRAVE